ncbi:unnamed protein product [Periconia digitata]|uniref:Uncharacterized protein n=1 Tax=Periconia digitata TaxID=1303443 RepID=A0A9W4XT18_9PLEO|nr:unnamed protein product [Periconia digitata]
MPSSSVDSQNQPKRPPMPRHNSSTSHISQSPSETTPHKTPKAPRQHVVGGGRMQRNTSAGKNLNKLSKLTTPHAAAGDSSAKPHRRSHSGNSTSAPSSPGLRPGFKRNASSGGIMRVANQGHGHGHGHPNIRKNHSSGHLARQAKPALKSSKSEIAPPKRSLAYPGRVRSPSPEHPTVHFDVGDVEENDGWTEESASQSPNTTRSNTRSNSMVMHSHQMTEDAPLQKPAVAPAADDGPGEAVSAPHLERGTQQTHTHPITNSFSHKLPDRTRPSHQSSGSEAPSHSRPADADMITSRLLQRSSHQNAPPQMSSVAATVVSNYSEVRELSQSGGSTLIDTPGRDLVSRFIDGDGSAGTPLNSSFLPGRNSPQAAAVPESASSAVSAGGSDADKIKRNRSMPNVAGGDAPTPAPNKAQHRRSGTGTPTDLPPSRTQQKLMLQRASSNIEPQKLIPIILPRTGGPSFIHTGLVYSTNSEGRLDPRLQQQFNHVAVEYSVVRRYRNPLSDAIKRMQQIPGIQQKTRLPRRTAIMNGHSSQQTTGSNSLSTSFNDDADSRRSRRVSLDNGGGSADIEGRQSFESSDGGGSGRIRNEAEEICRRLWESTEAVEGD